MAWAPASCRGCLQGGCCVRPLHCTQLLSLQPLGAYTGPSGGQVPSLPKDSGLITCCNETIAAAFERSSLAQSLQPRKWGDSNCSWEDQGLSRIGAQVRRGGASHAQAGLLQSPLTRTPPSCTRSPWVGCWACGLPWKTPRWRTAASGSSLGPTQVRPPASPWSLVLTLHNCTHVCSIVLDSLPPRGL